MATRQNGAKCGLQESGSSGASPAPLLCIKLSLKDFLIIDTYVTIACHTHRSQRCGTKASGSAQAALSWLMPRAPAAAAVPWRPSPTKRWVLVVTLVAAWKPLCAQGSHLRYNYLYMSYQL